MTTRLAALRRFQYAVRRATVEPPDKALTQWAVLARAAADLCEGIGEAGARARFVALAGLLLERLEGHTLPALEAPKPTGAKHRPSAHQLKTMLRSIAISSAAHLGLSERAAHQIVAECWNEVVQPQKPLKTGAIEKWPKDSALIEAHAEGMRKAAYTKEMIKEDVLGILRDHPELWAPRGK